MYILYPWDKSCNVFFLPSKFKGCSQPVTKQASMASYFFLQFAPKGEINFFSRGGEGRGREEFPNLYGLKVGAAAQSTLHTCFFFSLVWNSV